MTTQNHYKMPTVALVAPELFPVPPIRGGAAETIIDRVAAHLRRWRPIVISPSDPDLPDHEAQGGVEYFRIPLSGWRRWLYRRYRQHFPVYERGIAKILERVQPQVIQVYNRPLLALSLKKYAPHIPVILRMGNLSRILGKRERPAPGTVIPVDGFVAVSRYVLEREQRRLSLGAVPRWVIYNGVDPQTFVPRWADESLARSCRSAYGLNREPTVVYVGKIRESKGVGLLVEAMFRVWQTMPEAVLVLAGGTEFGRGRTDRITPFYKVLQEKVAKAPGRVILTGFIPPAQINRAYLLGDIFVGPSQNEEGLGMVFLEASACGLPIISTRMGGIPEVVHEGLNGLLLERKDDAGELAEKILLLLRNEPFRRQLAHQAREWVCRNFGWDKIAREQEHVFDAVTGHAAKGL